MVAAKFLDTIARMPGMKGQAADAVKAYTQVPLINAPALLGLPENECPETWISLPPSRQPDSWKNIQDPVCPLERNLYGHPLAGLLWERHFGSSTAQTTMGKRTRMGVSVPPSREAAIPLSVRRRLQDGRQGGELPRYVEKDSQRY